MVILKPLGFLTLADKRGELKLKKWRKLRMGAA